MCEKRQGSAVALWHLVPGAAVQEASRLFLVNSTPLFEEEGHADFAAAVADLENPLAVHGAGARPRFAADDDPVYAVKVQVRNWAEERFK